MSDEMIDENTETPIVPPLPKSKFKYGNKPLNELSHLELLEAVEGIWEAKNKELATVVAERDGLRKLLASPFPIHTLWRTFADNAMLLGYIALLAYLAGGHHG